MEISQSINTDAGNLNTKQYNKTLKSEANRKNKTIKKIRKESEIEINQEQDRLNNKINILHLAQTRRLETIKRNYDNSIKFLKKRFDSELEKIKTSFLNSKTKIYGQDNDDFIDRIDLKTKVRDKENHVEIEVQIPKNQASNLFMAVNKREVRLNLNRHYQDIYEKDDSKIQYNKKHSLTKEINVNDILSEKNISKIIMEDKTVFKIPKA